MNVDRGDRPLGSGRTLSAEPEREGYRVIRDCFRARLAVRTMDLQFERWGFTQQKPMKKAYEQSPAVVKKWLQEEYAVIAACAKVEGAEIHWGE